MKIEEVPIKAAEEELKDSRFFVTAKYREVFDRINEIDNGVALVIKCENKKECINLGKSMQSYNNRNGKRYLINCASKVLKVFVRVNQQASTKKGDKNKNILKGK